jgi:hypothetical protein
MDISQQLRELHQLHQSGALSDEEFAKAKQAVLGDKLGESKTVNPGKASEPPDVGKGNGVIAEVVVSGHLWGGGAWFKVMFNGELLGEHTLREGCKLSFQTTPGDHTLKVTCGAAGEKAAKETKIYAVSFPEIGSYRVTLTAKTGLLGKNPEFADAVSVLLLAPAAGQEVSATMPTSVPSADPTAVPEAAPAEVPLSEPISCKVRTGWSLRHSTDLILGPDRIRLGDRELLATDVEWIRCYEESIAQGGRPTITKQMELGNPSTSLKFNLCDSAFSKGNTAVFPRILSIVNQFYAPRIVRKMIDTLASGGSFNIGKLRFTPIGVEIPKTKYLIFSDKPAAVPWARAKCGFGAVRAAKRAAILNIITGIGLNHAGAYVFDSASEYPDSTGYEEKLWTPNACLIEPLVQYMREHQEISGGPWYVARDKQKVGPFVWSQLLKMASDGTLQPAEMLLQEGATKWSAAATIPGLFSGE